MATEEAQTVQSSSAFRLSFSQWTLSLFTLCVGGYLLAATLSMSDNAILGGTSKILFRDNVLRLSFNTLFHSLQLNFSDTLSLPRPPAVGTYILGVFSQIDTSLYDYTLSGSMLTIRLKDEYKSPQPVCIILTFAPKGRTDIPPDRFITDVFINQSPVPLSRFYKTHINRIQSNVSYYKPLDIRNISNTLANLFGESLVILVTFILLVMFAAQIFILVATFGKQYLPSLYEVGGGGLFPLNWIDGFAENYATLCGFLGTVLSIWVSLELAHTDYGDFLQILSLLKYAVFTTVLGLMVRIIYGVRVYLYGLFPGKLDN